MSKFVTSTICRAVIYTFLCILLWHHCYNLFGAQSLELKVGEKIYVYNINKVDLVKVRLIGFSEDSIEVLTPDNKTRVIPIPDLTLEIRARLHNTFIRSDKVSSTEEESEKSIVSQSITTKQETIDGQVESGKSDYSSAPMKTPQNSGSKENIAIATQSSSDSGGGAAIVLSLIVIAFIGYSIVKTLFSPSKPNDRASRRNGSASRSSLPLTESIYGKLADEKAPHQASSARSTLARTQSLTWINPNQPYRIGNYDLKCGLFYICNGRTRDNEPSAINTKLRLATPDYYHGDELPYFPSYENLSPTQRGSYLDWLSKGRKDEHLELREFGYIFIFIYGLERRVLIDGDYNQAIGEEIARLMTVYAPHGKSKSLPNYCSQLLHHWAWRKGDTVYSELWPWILNLEHSILGEDELKLVLHNLASSGKNAPAIVAKEIASKESNAKRSTIARRAYKEFNSLFEARFKEEFPSGLPLSLGKRTVLARYLPASAELRYETGQNESRFASRVKYVLIKPNHKRTLVSIWNSCCSDLSGYARAKDRSGGCKIDLQTLIATPRELWADKAKAWSKSLNDLVKSGSRDEESVFLRVSDVCEFYKIPKREKYTSGQSKQIAQGFEALGWAMEPDPRIHGISLSDNKEIVIFKLNSTEQCHREYLGWCALIQLSITVAFADGSFVESEQETVASLIDNCGLPDSEVTRLLAWSRLLGGDLSNAPATTRKVAKAVPREESQAVGQMLCHLAQADGTVTKGEEKELIKIFRNLELSDDIIARFKNELEGFDEVKVLSGQAPTPGEPIPQPKEALLLNRQRIEELTIETKAVIGILADAMADAESEIVQEDSKPTSTQEYTDTTDSQYEGLDTKLIPLLNKIIEKETWNRSDLESAARELHIVPGAAIDSINEWADDELGDFLLDGDDPICVNLDIIQTPSL